eukprot:2745083-Prymnesium_polylepis.1
MVKRLQARWRARKVVKWPLYKRMLLGDVYSGKVPPVEDGPSRDSKTAAPGRTSKNGSKAHGKKQQSKGWLSWGSPKPQKPGNHHTTTSVAVYDRKKWTETGAGFNEQGHALELTRLLQLLCENHCNALQDLVAEQPDAGSGSVNLVLEVFNLLKALEVGVDRSDIALTTQCVALNLCDTRMLRLSIGSCESARFRCCRSQMHGDTDRDGAGPSQHQQLEDAAQEQVPCSGRSAAHA